jgi:hypothetical protein
MANELNINVFTLKHWLRKYRPETMSTPNTAERPLDWTHEERLLALMASYGLDDEALSAFCRWQGLFPHHLENWKQAFINAPKDPALSDKSLREENKQFKKDLNRKEKALAEAAALLVLQKSFKRSGRKRRYDCAPSTQTTS